MRRAFLLLILGGASSALILIGPLVKPAVPSQANLSPAFESQLNEPQARPSEKPESATARKRALRDWTTLALNRLSAETDSARQEILWTELLDRFTAEDIPIAIFNLKDLRDSESYAGLQQRLVQRWTRLDAASASAWAVALPAGKLREQAMEQVATTWSALDLPSAAHWAKQMADEDRSKTLFTIATEAIRTQPVETLRLADDLPPNDARVDLVCRATGEWAATDSRSAADWAANISEPELRDQAIAKVVIAWSNTDPAAAATVAVNQLPSGKLQSDTVVAIVQRWAQKEPAAAAAWVALFPPGAIRDTAIENLHAQWSQTDAVSAAR